MQVFRPEGLVTARGMERLRFAPWGVAGGRASTRGARVGKTQNNTEEVSRSIASSRCAGEKHRFFPGPFIRKGISGGLKLPAPDRSGD